MRNHSAGVALAILALSLSFAGAGASATTLQIDPPWQTAGPNTGSVGATNLTATLTNDLWSASGFVDENGNYQNAGHGSLAIAGAVGDFFVLSLGSSPGGLVETMTITLGGPLDDPIFYFSDLDAVGGTLTVSPGGSVFESNADGVWNGNTLTVLNGGSGFGAIAAVQYAGSFGSGSSFSFTTDYSGLAVSFDSFLIGVGVVPEPSTLVMLTFTIVLAGATLRRRA
jgi:hypothetical protein